MARRYFDHNGKYKDGTILGDKNMTTQNLNLIPKCLATSYGQFEACHSCDYAGVCKMTVKKDALKEILDDLDSVLGLFDSVKEVATKKAKSEVRWNEQDKPKL